MRNSHTPQVSDVEAHEIHTILKRVIHLLPPTLITTMNAGPGPGPLSVQRGAVFGNSDSFPAVLRQLIGLLSSGGRQVRYEGNRSGRAFQCVPESDIHKPFENEPHHQTATVYAPLDLRQQRSSPVSIP